MTLKQDRVAERVKGILSELLLREVSDPRLQGVTVTDVRVDPEIMFADIYVSALGDDSREDDVMAGLRSASGFLRRSVGKRLSTRNTPELHFHWDRTLQRGEQINRLLDNLDIPEASPDDDTVLLNIEDYDDDEY